MIDQIINRIEQIKKRAEEMREKRNYERIDDLQVELFNYEVTVNHG